MKTPQLPFPKLSEAIGIPNEVWLKREDLHKYGSHKGRSIPLMIMEYAKLGVTNFIISSSGNAALAAAQAIDTYNRNHQTTLSLVILVGENIDAKKLNLLKTAFSNPLINTRTPSGPNSRHALVWFSSPL